MYNDLYPRITFHRSFRSREFPIATTVNIIGWTGCCCLQEILGLAWASDLAPRASCALCVAFVQNVSNPQFPWLRLVVLIVHFSSWRSHRVALVVVATRSDVWFRPINKITTLSAADTTPKSAINGGPPI
jgi:hypothetical protein